MFHSGLERAASVFGLHTRRRATAGSRSRRWGAARSLHQKRMKRGATAFPRLARRLWLIITQQLLNRRLRRYLRLPNQNPRGACARALANKRRWRAFINQPRSTLQVPPRDLTREIVQMNSSKTTRRGPKPAGRVAQLPHRVRHGNPASIKITRTVTSDSLDGQPWPPTERNVLWRLLRRTDGRSHWRAIELAQIRATKRTSMKRDEAGNRNSAWPCACARICPPPPASKLK